MQSIITKSITDIDKQDTSSNKSSESTGRGRKKAQGSKNQAIRKSFEEFMNELKFSSTKEIESVSDKILPNLNFKTPGILDKEQLTRMFDEIINKLENKCRYGKVNWTEKETNFFVSLVVYYCSCFKTDFQILGDNDWEYIGKLFPTKQASQLKKRWNSILKVNVVQSPWTAAEDELLGALVAQYGSERQWKIIADKINTESLNGGFRHPRQCRERWNNYVDPKIKRGEWRADEDLNLLKGFIKLGKKWSAIGKCLGDRTENAVRNRLHSLLKKICQDNIQARMKNEALQDFEVRMAAQYLEQIGNNYSVDTTKSESQISEEIQYISYYQEQSESPALIETQNYQSVLPTQTDLICPEDQNEANILYLKPVVALNPTECGSYGWDSDFSPRTHNPLLQMKNEIEWLEMQTNSAMQTFRFCSGYEAEQKFSEEISKEGSKVFYALVDPSKQEIKLMEKVSGANWNKYMNNNAMYY